MRARPTIRVLRLQRRQLVDEVLRIAFGGHERPRRLDAHAHQFLEQHAIRGLRRSTMYAGICRSTGSSLSVAFCAASVAPTADKTRNAARDPHRRFSPESSVCSDRLVLCLASMERCQDTLFPEVLYAVVSDCCRARRCEPRRRRRRKDSSRRRRSRSEMAQAVVQGTVEQCRKDGFSVSVIRDRRKRPAQGVRARRRQQRSAHNRLEPPKAYTALTFASRWATSLRRRRRGDTR